MVLILHSKQIIGSHPAWVCGLKHYYKNRLHDKQSHTLRGCVDWNLATTPLTTYISVTPCVGVWIETCVFPGVLLSGWSHPAWVCGLKHRYQMGIQVLQSHTLRGCVDWNHFLLLNCLACKGHTLRGCVDWNNQSFNAYQLVNRHTLRGCVDWNLQMLRHFLPLKCHTLRGCVDWNFQNIT